MTRNGSVAPLSEECGRKADGVRHTVQRRVGAMLVTASLLSVSGAAAATSGRVTRSFVVDVEPGNATMLGTIEIVGNEPKEKGDKTRVDLSITPAGLAEGKPVAGDKKKSKGTAPKTHELHVDVTVSAKDAVQSIEVSDLNFDGYRDLWILRENSAEGARYEAFIFDPKSGKFSQSAFSSELGKLTNPELDPLAKHYTSRRTGESPTRVVHRVTQGKLSVIESCEFKPSAKPADGATQGTLTKKKLVDGTMSVSSKEVAIPKGFNPCE